MNMLYKEKLFWTNFNEKHVEVLPVLSVKNLALINVYIDV